MEDNEDKEQSTLHSEKTLNSKALMEAGWYQGVIFDISETYEGLEVGSYIVLNQSCDLLYHCLSAEPFLEVLKVEKVELGSNGNHGSLMYGKSTRGLIFECENDNLWSAPSLIYRETLNRKSLEELSPKTKVKDVRNFSSWLGRRYDRVAFPDNFNNLFSNARKGNAQKAYKKFVKFVKEIDSKISEIWIKLNSWEELPSELDYSISLVLLLNESGNSQKEEIKALFEELIEGDRGAKESDGVVKLTGIRGCLIGIEIEEYDVLEKSEFSRAEIEVYSLFNLDYISHSSGSDTPSYR